ncbi:MAG: S8 family serine peptidase [Streptosporangiaceae bacterium]|nr:S8 family serine peptidase [Streptosporangiaceae bacterium]
MRSFGSLAVLPAALSALLAGAAAGAPPAGPPERPPGHAVTAPGPGGAPPGQPAAAGTALPPDHAWTVTLVTGDVVGVRTVHGGPPLVTIRPGRGRQRVIFSTYTSTRGNIEVLPRDVAPLVGKVLDPALFDVTTLIRDGDDDAHRSYLPLIVQGGAGTSAASAARALSPALRQGTVLSSIGAIAVREPKATAVQAGHALAAMAPAAARPGRIAPGTGGDLRYIWLDRTVRVVGEPASRLAPRAAARRAQLDHNLVQIGAATAWRAGDTGRGIKIAVLDTGIDATHPDLRGQILLARNFSGSPGVADRFGHGTFVAGQIAGTGAAAAGERRGVAFGAKLVIGKVLNDDGTGAESSIIAGMDWAATRARVISMSLGGLPSDGTDPLSQAVNRLTAADHVLFVIAAGNDGSADETVTSPGAATDALTVGAVDGSDRLAWFSSRGPRVGDYAIKPEITAPGVSIVGDRAAGTAMGSLVDALYTSASGTSMATPQVAGAAAILAALHPRWSPAMLKAALVSTAHAATGGDIYELGGGMLNVAAAVTDSVVADQAVADLGSVPAGSARTISDRLSWTNTGKRAATADLSAELTDHAGRPAPAGALRLTAGTLRIAAGGSASATLSLAPGSLARHPGLYEGDVIARDGAQITRTPISLYVQPPMYILTLRATALPGTAAGDMAAGASVIDTGDPDLFQQTVTVGPDGTATVQVPAGHYWVAGEVDDLTNPRAQRSALAGQPDVAVTRDTTVTLNGAAAVPVTASVTGHPTRVAQASVHIERGFAGQVWAADVYFFGPPSAAPVLYAQPSGTAGTGTFRVYTAFRLISPASTAPYVYDLYHSLGGRVPPSLTYTVTPAQQATLARVSERFYALNGNTAPMEENRYGLTATGFLAIQNNVQVAGGQTLTGGSARTDYLSTEAGIGWNQEVSPPFTLNGQNDLGVWTIEVPGFEHYAPGSRRTADWARQPFRPGPYSATGLSLSYCAPQPTTRSRGDIHVELVDLQDLPDGYDCLGGPNGVIPWLAATSRTMRLYRDGRLAGSAGSSVADFTVPAAAASYRLTYADNTSAALPVSTQTTTTWTFRSAAPAGLAPVRIPLLVVNYDLPLGLDNRPDGGTAVLSVTRIAGTPPARVTGLKAWTSTDNGKSWQLAAVHPLGGGRYSFTPPHAAPGQAVSLRVRAADTGGSGIDQTIMTAYRG